MRKLHPHYFLFTSCLSAAVVPYGALANPEGGSVVAGSAVITSSGNTVDIHQSTNRAIIDWRSFDIAPNETTRFHQPDASSHTLNRVNSMSRSVIEGTIQANGNITIVNPNGVFFKQGSTVDVGGLTATTADTTNANFMAGKAQHDIASANTAAEVRNDGTITVRDSGLVALVAPSVANDGVITAKLGKVHLASGDSFVMDVGGDGHMQVAMSQHTLQRQLVSNSGKISADGGYVALTAAAARDAVDSLITNTGVIEAKSVGAIQGKVLLQGAGAGSTIVHAGIIDVSGKRAAERGGKVEILADQIALAGTSKIDASGHTGATGTTNGTAVSAVRNGAAGGDIKIGGDYQGQGATPTATKLFVAHGAVIKNDAISSGDAGRTILWSDDTTQFNGTISATSINGKGGFTEVSGKNTLGFNGVVDLRSTLGSQGTLLLDPTDITISTAANTGTMLWDGTSFSDTVAATSNLNTTTLQNQLALSDVIVTTASGLGGVGTIDVTDAISWNSGFSLTLLADSDITVRANIVNSGSGNIAINSGGDFWLRNAAMIDAGGGSLTLSPLGTIYNMSTNTTPFTGTGLTINAPLTFLNGTGSIRTLNAKTGMLTLNGAIDSNIVTDLNLRADDIAINDTISTVNRVNIAPFTSTRTIGVDTAGDMHLSDAELDLISASALLRFGTLWGVSDHAGGINVGARNWGASAPSVSFSTSSGLVHVQGAQTVVSSLGLGGTDYRIDAALTGATTLSFSNFNIADFTMGGAAGTTILDSTELDYITNGWTLLVMGANQPGNITLQAYNNWRDAAQFSVGGTVTVAGAQSTLTGGAGFGFASAAAINADIDFSLGGYIFLHQATTLSANLISNSLIDIRRPLTLGGAAGVIRTINAGTGDLIVRNNGGGFLGSITAGDKNLVLRADNMDIQGAVSAASGAIFIGASTLSKTIGLAGAAGDLLLSNAELDLISTPSLLLGYLPSVGEQANINVGARTWLAGNGALNFSATNYLDFQGAQTFQNTVGIGARDVNIGDTLSIATANSYTLNIQSSQGSIGLAGAAGDLQLSATELDRIADGWAQIGFGGNHLGTVTANAYSNWRDTVLFNPFSNFTIAGAQTTAAGSNASITLRPMGNYNATISGDLDARLSGGSVTLANHTGSTFNLGADIYGVGVTIDASTTLTGAAGTTRTINAGTGTLAINNNGTSQLGSIAAGNKNLELRSDTIDIGGSVTGAGSSNITLNAHSTARSVGLAGGAGDFNVDVNELNRITGFGSFTLGPITNTGLSTTNIGAYDWTGKFADYVDIRRDGAGPVNIHGAQTFTSSQVFLWGDFNITAAISNIGGQFGFYRSSAAVTLGGNNAASWLNSTELDFIADGSTGLYFASGSMTMEAYNNWRDFVQVQGSGVSSTLTISGAQTAAAGSNSSITLGNIGGYQYFNTIDINADVDFSGSTTGGISIVGRPNTVFAAGTANLGANITSGVDGITIDRAVTLTGAAGTTRTINARSGTLAINNNGTTQLGSIDVSDKTLNFIGDNMTIGGAITGTGTIGIRGFDQNRTMGLAGGAGDLQLDSTELDLITVSNQRYGHWIGVGAIQRGITVGARTWGALSFIEFMNTGGTGFTTTGAQDFGAADVQFFASQDFVIGDTFASTGSLNFYGYTGSLGGGAGVAKLDSVELDRLADGFSTIYFGGGSAGDITVQAYNNWRDAINFNTNGIVTIAAAQSAGAGSNASLQFAANAGAIVNANIDFSDSTTGGLTFDASGARTLTLGADITSGVSGITINRATTLSGVAGTTRTINAGTGGFVTSVDGDITATDKNLTVIADSVALLGDITSTSGDITLRPYDAARTIAVGTAAAGGFHLDDTELALLDSASGLLTIGSSTHAAAYAIESAHTFNEHVRFLTGNTGLMRINDSLGGTKNMTFATGTGSLGITSSLTISSTGGNVAFGAIDGDGAARNLTVNAAAGSITFGGAVGANTALGHVGLTSLNAMSLPELYAASLFARTLGATSDITLNGVLTLSDAGTALELVSGDDIINNHGAGVFNLTGGGRFLTWSDDPLQDTGEEHFSGAATKRYNRNYGDAVDPTGNFRNYSVAPTLTIRGNNTQYTYGDAVNAPTTYAITGWHMAEDEAAHSMGGAATFQTSYAQGNNAGTSYAVTNNGSTLSSDMGYQIGYAASPSLTVNKANLRVKAVNLNYTAGSGVPVVTFLYEPTDFRMGQNAGTAGITGSATVSNINWNTIAAGTYAMQVGLGGLSAINYSFSELMPRGTLTVTGAAPVITPPAHNNLPSTVQQVMNNAGILYTGTSLYGASGTNNGANTNSATRKARDTNAGTGTQNVSLYDVGNGQVVASVLGTIFIDPAVLETFGLSYEPLPGNNI